MALTLGANIAALQVQRELARSADALSKVYERLSSGMRINRASDDAAGLAIADSLNADVRVYNQAIRNVSDATSLLNIADGALGELRNVVMRQKELAEQAANGVYSLAQRKALDSEANALVEEFNRIIGSTTYNGERVFNAQRERIAVQCGYGSQGVIEIDLSSELGRTAGTGAFGAEVVAARPSLSYDAALGDFDHDGDIDMYTSNGYLLLGNGDGSFLAPVACSNVGTNIAEAVDVNGDGILDIVGNLSATSIRVALGNGNGTFKASVVLCGRRNDDNLQADRRRL